MAKSQRIRLRDVRVIFRLVNECCELGADPVVWRTHLLQGLNQVLGAQVACGGRCDLQAVATGATSLPQILEVFGDVGWPTSAERKVYLESLDRFVQDRDPFLNPYIREVARRGDSPQVCTRRALVSDDEWYRSEFGQCFLEPSGTDDLLVTLQNFDRGKLLMLCVNRDRHERPFDEREARLLQLIREEICTHLDRRLAMFDAPTVLDLPARQREVLKCLLEGDAEKQVARRLNLSPHTVHEHIKRLHKHFGVSSRGELLAKCLRYLPCLAEVEKRIQ